MRNGGNRLYKLLTETQFITENIKIKLGDPEEFLALDLLCIHAYHPWSIIENSWGEDVYQNSTENSLG